MLLIQKPQFALFQKINAAVLSINPLQHTPQSALAVGAIAPLALALPDSVLSGIDLSKLDLSGILDLVLAGLGAIPGIPAAVLLMVQFGVTLLKLIFPPAVAAV